jgi:hypothetical protein
MIDKIRYLCAECSIVWTAHIALRLRQRNIKTEDVEFAVLTGEIIENYVNDYPYPSCLILGKSVKGQWLHVVCGIGKDELRMVTAYYPNPLEWSDDLKTRKA